jgi:hypothetical protein
MEDENQFLQYNSTIEMQRLLLYKTEPSFILYIN